MEKLSQRLLAAIFRQKAEKLLDEDPKYPDIQQALRANTQELEHVVEWELDRHHLAKSGSLRRFPRPLQRLIFRLRMVRALLKWARRSVFGW